MLRMNLRTTAVLLTLASGAQAQTQPPPHPHATGFEFQRNSYITNGKTVLGKPGPNPSFLVQQDDGNLCVYAGTPQKQGPFISCSLRASQPRGNYFTVFQTDGNICTYKGTGPADNKGGVWCSNTARGPGHYYAIVDGLDLTLYAAYGAIDWNAQRIWSFGSGHANPAPKPKVKLEANAYGNCVRSAQSSRAVILRRLPFLQPTATIPAPVIQSYRDGLRELDKQWAAMESKVTDGNNPASADACKAVSNKYVEMSQGVMALK